MEDSNRAASPALSELTVLSRSPSPVWGYEEELMGRMDGNSSRIEDGVEDIRPSPYGTLAVLPREIRQRIYDFVFETSNPIVLKPCCGPLADIKTRCVACSKRKPKTSPAARFNVLQLSRHINEEAGWVFYNESTVLVQVNEALSPFIDAIGGKTLRWMSKVARDNGPVTDLWRTVARFGKVIVEVPELQLSEGNPNAYLRSLCRAVQMICFAQNDLQVAGGSLPIRGASCTVLQAADKKIVHIILESLFHELLPYNYASQGDEREGELIAWMNTHSRTDDDPDFALFAADADHELARMLKIVDRFRGDVEWVLSAQDRVHRKDVDAYDGIRKLRQRCAEAGVKFVDG